jgi:hypothetical protein
MKFEDKSDEDIERELRSFFYEYENLVRNYQSEAQQNGQISETFMLKINQLKENIVIYQKEREESLNGWLQCANDRMLGEMIPDAELSAKLRSLRRDFRKVATGGSGVEFDLPFDEEYRFYENAIFKLEETLKSRGVVVAPEEIPRNLSEELRKQVRQSAETERKMWQDCEEEVRQATTQQQADIIRKIYRQAIDRLREEQ